MASNLPNPTTHEDKAAETTAAPVTLTVSGDDPKHGIPPTFANFMTVSHVGGEVQLEFIFLDINQLAITIQRVKESVDRSESEIQGKTVAKMVVPVTSFLQVKDHLLAVFKRLEENNEPPKETGQVSKAGEGQRHGR